MRRSNGETESVSSHDVGPSTSEWNAAREQLHKIYKSISAIQCCARAEAYAWQCSDMTKLPCACQKYV